MMIDTGGAALGTLISIAVMGVAGILAAKRCKTKIKQ
jgi:hypothetical protein